MMAIDHSYPPGCQHTADKPADSIGMNAGLLLMVAIALTLLSGRSQDAFRSASKLAAYAAFAKPKVTDGRYLSLPDDALSVS